MKVYSQAALIISPQNLLNYKVTVYLSKFWKFLRLKFAKMRLV